MPLRLRLAMLFALGTASVIAVAGLGSCCSFGRVWTPPSTPGCQPRGHPAEQYNSEGLGALRATRDEEPVQVRHHRRPAADLLARPGDRTVARPARAVAVIAARRRARSGFTTGEDRRTHPLAGHGALRPRALVLVVGTGTDIADAADEHVDTGAGRSGPIAVLARRAGRLVALRGGAAPGRADAPGERRTARHDDGTHLAVPSTRDEIASLASTLNELLDRQRRRSPRNARPSSASAGSSPTPATSCGPRWPPCAPSSSSPARPGRDRDELVEAVSSAAGETDRLIRLAEDLLTLARADGSDQFLRVLPDRSLRR